MFYPDTAKTRSYLKLFAENNAKRTGQTELQFSPAMASLNSRPSRQLDIVPVGSEDFIYDYVLKNPNVTNWAIVFNEAKEPNPNIQYQVWYNSTLTAEGIDVFGIQLISFMRGIDEAILSILNDPTATVKAKLNVNLKEWPKVPPLVLSDSIVQQLV